MSTQHEPITIKPISEVAAYLRNLIPPGVLESYALKPRFDNVANADDIRSGVIAFKDFINIFCDRLISDGHLYAKAPKKPSSMADYPFLHNVTNLLVDMGYHGKPAEDGSSLLIGELPLCSLPKPKISPSAQAECKQFLTLCGFTFDGQEVSYPSNPVLLVGLKPLSIADMELRTDRRYWNDNNLLRCDYRLLKADKSDILDELRDFLHPLPKKVQSFVVALHKRYVDVGLTCINTRLGEVTFAYANIGNSHKQLAPRDIYGKRIYAISYSLKNGYNLFVRTKKTEKYADVIKTFHASLQEKIAQGYGCDRKYGERCQHGCQGIRIPLDNSVLDIAKDIEIWLDNEMPKK